jgi:hypothetical protein
MQYFFVCRVPFGQHAKGDIITDPTEIAAVMANQPAFVIRIYATAPSDGASLDFSDASNLVLDVSL